MVASRKRLSDSVVASPQLRSDLESAYSDGIALIYLIAVPFALCAVIAAILLPGGAIDARAAPEPDTGKRRARRFLSPRARA